MGQRLLPTRGISRAAISTAMMALVIFTAAACAPDDGDSASSGVTPNTAPGLSETASEAPDVTATVPAPDGGTVDEVVEEVAPGAVQQVDIDAVAELPGSIEMTVASAERLDVVAETPGEVAGPAVALTLAVHNGGAESIPLDTAMVSVTGAAGAFGQPTTSRPSSPFTGTLDAGESATATYVFLLPADQRDSLSITVEYVAGAPIALFVGQII